MLRHILQNSQLRKRKSFRFIRASWIVSRGGYHITITLFFLAIGFLFLPWYQTVRGSGRVIAYSPNERAQSIDSPIYGRLGKWFVQEGSFVREGDPIVEIIDNDPDILTRLNQQRDAVKKNLDAAGVAVSNSKNNYMRLAELLKQGVVSQRDYEKAKIEYSKLLADEAKVSAELVKIDTKVARQSAQNVTAPMNGYIQRRKSGSGSQLVKVGDELALLVPDTKSRSVEVFISGNDAPFVHKDDRVRIQFEGWPAVQSLGWPSLAKGTFGGRVVFVDRQLNLHGQSRLLIVPDEDPWPNSEILRQGVRVYAWVLLNKVSVGFELWRNFNGFPPIVSQEGLYRKVSSGPDSDKPVKIGMRK